MALIPVDRVIALCGTATQPPADELAKAPVLDDWRFPKDLDGLDGTEAGDRVFAVGNLSGSPTFENGMRLATSCVSAIAADQKWIRCVDGNLYRLGCRHEPNALVLRAASMKATTPAYSYLDDETGRHTLDWETLQLLNEVTISVTTGTPESVRDTAVVFADAMQAVGRSEVADAWRLLATYGDKLSCGVIRRKMAEGFADGSSQEMLTMMDGWSMLAAGRTFGLDLSDIIKAAHTIGKLAADARRAQNDPYKGGEGTDINDGLLSEVPVKIEEPQEGVVVVEAIGGSKDSWAGKPVVQEFKSIVGKKLPLRPVPALASVRRTLLAEFPYAERAIDVLLSDLEARADVHFRPTIVVGAPGCGKSRLIRRLGDALDVYVGRYDGSGAEDNALGGTARRWSSGEPCWPLNVMRAAGHANPILHVDELDKAATSQRNGSLAYALLPMLEIETSNRYPDPYIQADIDISHVSYLLTVNDDAGLPAPLKDRLRILRMPAMGPEHVQSVADSIVTEIAKDRGLAAGWYPRLDGDEIEIARRLLGDGSIRRLRTIVEKLIAARDGRAARH